jgi:methionyl-tRNA formyltransferase
MSKPSIIYMGTPDFAVAPLNALVENNFDVKAVVTVADKPSGRGQQLRMSAVKQYALDKNIKVLQPLKLKSSEFLEELKALNADLFIVIAFRMLPKEVWQMPKLGTFNIHGSLLPNYRGAAPINWAIINGDTKTGVTSFFINEEIDSGKMIDSLAVDISKEDSAGTLHDKLMYAASELVVKTTELISNGNLSLKSQELSGKENPAPKIFKGDCEIDWSKPIYEIYNFIRGLSPYPVAWSSLYQDEVKLGQLRIFKTTILSTESQENHGKVEFENGGIHVILSTGILQIDELQWPGKKKMDVKSFLNGFRAQENLSVIGHFG